MFGEVVLIVAKISAIGWPRERIDKINQGVNGSAEMVEKPADGIHGRKGERWVERQVGFEGTGGR